MPSPQGRPYITLQELKALGLSAQFANSPLLLNPAITDVWVEDQGFAANSLITPVGWTDVTVSGSGSPSDVAASGVPNQAAPVDFQVLITETGGLGVATFMFSFDGGLTFSPNYLVEASVALEGTGVTLTFANVTFTNTTRYSTSYENNGFFYASLGSGESGATQPDFPTGVGQTVLDNTVTWVCQGPNTNANLCIMSASEYCDGFLRSKFGLSWPLTQWGYDLKMACAQVAALYVAKIRGYNPALPAEAIYETGYDKATKWLRDVANGLITPDVTTAQSVAPGAADPKLDPTVVSPNFPPRRWVQGTRGTQWR